MINLTPIPTKIQERMKEKMSVLGRERQISPGERVDSDKLKLEEMMTRTTFIRMTSGQVNPVILMGGKLDDNLNMPEGYSEIYGPRSYSKRETGPKGELIQKDEIGYFYEGADGFIEPVDDNPNQKILFKNSLRRPTPGIKNIDVTFKGGLKTNREATISWTCWSWEEIDLLTPHFLAHGKTVLLEWGWVYDKETLLNLPSFLVKDPNGGEDDIKIDASAFENYQEKVVEEDGNFDLMAGVIKNFEYTTREDGGFDCQTILTSVGINLIQREGGSEGSSETTDKSRVYNLNLRDENKLREFFSGDLQDSEVVTIDTVLSLKVFLSQIDNYVFETFFPLNQDNSVGGPRDSAQFGDVVITAKDYDIISEEQKADGGDNRTFILSEPNKAIVQLDTPNLSEGAIENYGKLQNVWVRWGWFEDNVLSKFLSLTSTDSTRPIHTKFRSVEKVLDINLKETNPAEYQSVKIRNNESLETVDINSYILPGQFFPTKNRKVKIGEEDITIEGDSTVLTRLKNATDKFKPFSTGENDGKTVDRFTSRTVEETRTISTRGGSMDVTQTRNVTGFQQNPSPGRYGHLRNMLINTRVIKSAFGSNLANEKTGELQSTEPINILESIENMFRNINGAGGLNLWNFQLKEDEKDGGSIKIVDDATTYFDFDDNNKKKQTKFDENNKVIGNTGVFYFPVWQSDSIVKRQNITTKIPSAIQLATMYGANANPVQEIENHATTFDATGVAAGGFNNANRDKQLENLNIAIKNPNSKQIGVKSGEENDILGINTGEDIIKYISENQIETLEKIYTEIGDEIAESVQKEIDAQFSEDLKKLFDDSKPIPSIDFLDDTDLQKLFDADLVLNSDVKEDKTFQKNRLKLLKSFASQIGAKFKDGKVRKKFLDFINERIIGFGSASNEDLPILIPFEIELEIDGIGGIYPANSFHSTYLPLKYQKAVIFQAKDVNHRVDSTGWTTTLVGVMRTTLNAVLLQNKKYKEFKDEYLENYIGKLRQTLEEDAKEISEGVKANKGAPPLIGIVGSVRFSPFGQWIANKLKPKKTDTGID